MHICYVDEAGCTSALPYANSPVQPVFVLGGLFLDEQALRPMTGDLLALKQRFFPNLLPPAALYHDWMAAEIKGSDIRRSARSAGRNDRRFAYGVISSALDILEKYNSQIVARVYIKPVAHPFNGSAVYTSTVQSVCTSFQQFLDARQSTGLVIADSRNKGKNANVSHSVFTQRYRAAGDPYPALVEVPTFGHSDNHTGLQMMDFVCSALLFPIAAQTCCVPYLTDQTHLSPHYEGLRSRYGERLKNMQFRYRDAQGMWRGGITLIDPVNKFNARKLFT